MAKAYIIASVRTAVGRAYKGSLKDTRPDDLGALAIRAALDRVPNLDPARIDDVIMGCAMPEGEQGMNVARICALKAGVPDSVPAMTINRFCSSGLQSIALAAERIRAGCADVVVAGGTASRTRRAAATATTTATYRPISLARSVGWSAAAPSITPPRRRREGP